MISDSDPIVVPGVSDVLIYSDHAVPGFYYYASTQPRVAKRDGVFQFALAQFEPPSENQAGILTFTTDLSLPEDVRNEILTWLEDHVEEDLDEGEEAPQVGLQPIPWLSGTATLVFLDGTRVTGSPSLIGDNSATFKLDLTLERYHLLEQTLRDRGRIPFFISYHLVYESIRPAYEYRATLSWERFREYIERRCSNAALVFIDFESVETFDRLLEERIIEIEEVNVDNDFKLEVLRSIIWSLTPVPSSASSPPGEDRWTVGYLCSELRDIEALSQTVDISANVVKAVSRSPKIQGPIADIHDAFNSVEIQIISTMEGAPFTDRQFQIECYDCFAADKIRSIQAAIHDGTTLIATHGFSASTDLIWKKELTYKPGDQSKHNYSYTVIFDREGVPNARSPKQEIKRGGSYQYINPRELYTARNIEISVPPHFPWDYVRDIIVELFLHDEKKDQKVLNEGHPSATWEMFSNTPHVNSFKYRAKYRPRRGTEIDMGLREDDASIVLNHFIKRTVVFHAQDIDWATYREVRVLVKGNNTALHPNQPYLSLTEAQREREFDFYYSDPNQLSLVYDLMYVPGATVRNLQSDAQIISIGNPPEP